MRKFLKTHRRAAIACALIAAALAGIFISMNFMVSFAASGCLFDNLENVPMNKVGLLLGCSSALSNGRPNLFFKQRIRAASELFHAGKVRYILISGDNGSYGYDEPTGMKDALVKAGVPAGRIVLDYAGFRTFDSIVRAKKVFGLSEFTVISQKFHNERAVFIAKGFGLGAIGYNAQAVGGMEGLRVDVREFFARVFAVLDVKVLGTKPKFLGEPIAIGGEGDKK